MKKSLLTAVVLLVAFLSVGFNTETSDSELIARKKLKQFVGEWKYEAPYAPYGYQEGVFNFTKEKKELLGTVALGSYETELEGLSVEKDVLKFYVIVEGTQVDMELTFDKDTFTGVAYSQQGDIPLTGTRQ